PGLPTAVTRATSEHTWPAFRGALDDVILDRSWADAFPALSRAGVPVQLVTGDADELLVPDRAAAVAADHESVSHEQWNGDHHLPLTHAPAAAHLVIRSLLPDADPGRH
ncbi:MAG: hypothetical protein AAGK32_17180, partial [Actinomycetota bacterium]